MPIYEYVCRSCGLEKEHLQKMSDSPIENCPECGSGEYVKQISAAGFQLKGSGWYVTDFKNKPASETKTKSKSETKSESTASSATTTE
ncbi:FmdB family zinc ribbon protein [Nitrosomonas sp. Nm34]|uniref:FmdB family zinc ribbon protein n=1 Tax=Nitrosomonas sp. Nm34 TaxID=1881055 RepID=UPI0008EEADBA|nr:zinc ribbon domain-containing protein [Nitrosomonas sp. Nm34]SFI87119.1 putative regulatory protein, FmdB family [Nitrosomonas sp. Nm34]